MKLAWPAKDGSVGVREGSAGGDDSGGGQFPPVGRHHDELAVLLTHRRHPGVGLDLDGERGGLVLEIVRDLVTGWVAVRVSGERPPGHRAERGRREQPQAVVVMRPGAGRAIAGLEDHDWHIHLGQRAGGGKAGLARADHHHGGIGAWSEVEIDIHG